MAAGNFDRCGVNRWNIVGNLLFPKVFYDKEKTNIGGVHGTG